MVIKEIFLKLKDDNGFEGFYKKNLIIGEERQLYSVMKFLQQNPLKYVGSKNKKEFMVDLKRVYKAVNNIWLKLSWITWRRNGMTHTRL